MAAQPLESGQVLSQSARVGTQREYETVLILRPQTAKPEITELINRMRGVIEERSGRLLKIDSWGMRLLSYPIKHCRKGIYLYWRYLGGSDIVAEFERHMRLSDKVVRFYTVRVDDDVDPTARPSEITEELLDAVAEPGPDPDDIARQRAAEEEARRAEDREHNRDRDRNHGDDYDFSDDAGMDNSDFVGGGDDE